MAKLIFIAEDDEGIRELYECAFIGASYEMRAFENAEDLINALNEQIPDIIVLDIMLPKMDGLTALGILKKATSNFKEIPVIMVSAKHEENIKVKGLMLGADDYVTKPFGVMELVARVNNISRRATVVSDVKLKYLKMEIDEKKHRICIDGNKLELTPKEYKIIYLLITRQGEVVSRDELLDSVWGEGYFGETRTLDIHITGIRQKISFFTDEKYIKTVRGVGYMIGE